MAAQNDQLSLLDEQTTTRQLSQYVRATYNDDGVLQSLTITVGELEAELEGDNARILLNKKRFIEGCECRPVLSPATGFVLVGNEDGCHIHGIEE